MSDDDELVARGRIREARPMNKTEASYAQELELRRRVGEILWYKYEAIKLRLADNTFYTPDFLVLAASYELQIHETKGMKWERSSRGIHYQKAHMEEDARVKIKVAAENFPFVFFLVYYTKTEGWRLEKM